MDGLSRVCCKCGSTIRYNALGCHVCEAVQHLVGLCKDIDRQAANAGLGIGTTPKEPKTDWDKELRELWSNRLKS